MGRTTAKTHTHRALTPKAVPREIPVCPRVVVTNNPMVPQVSGELHLKLAVHPRRTGVRRRAVVGSLAGVSAGATRNRAPVMLLAKMAAELHKAHRSNRQDPHPSGNSRVQAIAVPVNKALRKKPA